MPDKRNSLDAPQVSVLPEVAKGVLITITGVVVVAALACWLLVRMITWPYRSTHREGYDRGARIEATLALVTALTALVGTLRRGEGLS
jgi:hypothetical protein